MQSLLIARNNDRITEESIPEEVRVCMCVCVYACVYVCVCTRMCLYLCVYMDACGYVHMHVSTGMNVVLELCNTTDITRYQSLIFGIVTL